MESREITKHLSRCLCNVHQEALAWALGALSTRRVLHGNTSGAWLPSYFCPMPTVHGSLPPWALPWNTSLLLQPLISYLSSTPWPQTSALDPFLPQCPAEFLVPCQKLPGTAFTRDGQGAKEAKLTTPVHVHWCLCLSSKHSCCFSQVVPQRHASPLSPTWIGLFQGVQKSAKVADSGRMDTRRYYTHLCFFRKMRQRNSGIVMKVVSKNKCILTESSGRGDSVLVRTWCPAWSLVRTPRKWLQMYFW